MDGLTSKGHGACARRTASSTSKSGGTAKAPVGKSVYPLGFAKQGRADYDRGPQNHKNIGILHTMVSGIPLALRLRTVPQSISRTVGPHEGKTGVSIRKRLRASGSVLRLSGSGLWKREQRFG